MFHALESDRADVRKDVDDLKAIIIALSNTVTNLSNTVASQNSRLTDAELSN